LKENLSNRWHDLVNKEQKAIKDELKNIEEHIDIQSDAILYNINRDYCLNYQNRNVKDESFRYNHMLALFYHTIRDTLSIKQHTLKLYVPKKYEFTDGMMLMSRQVPGYDQGEEIDKKGMKYAQEQFGISDLHSANYTTDYANSNVKHCFDFEVKFEKIPEDFFNHKNFALFKEFYRINSKYFNNKDHEKYKEDLKVFQDRVEIFDKTNPTQTSIDNYVGDKIYDVYPEEWKKKILEKQQSALNKSNYSSYNNGTSSIDKKSEKKSLLNHSLSKIGSFFSRS